MNWYVALVEFTGMHWKGKEFAIQQRIREAGFDTFCPVEERTVLRRRRRVKVRRPLFGPYVFVQCEDWAGFRPYDDSDGTGIRGVCSLLANDKKPVRIADEVVEKIRQMADLGLFTEKPIAEGTRVQITEGPFANLVGKVMSATARKRVKVLLQNLGALDVDACILKKI